jgi:hypothetical protein
MGWSGRAPTLPESNLRQGTLKVRSSRRQRTLVTLMAQRGLSANELSGALISMMARRTRFTQRPDTLMQDRHRQLAEPSCDARPDHTYGSNYAVRPSLG